MFLFHKKETTLHKVIISYNIFQVIVGMVMILMNIILMTVFFLYLTNNKALYNYKLCPVVNQAVGDLNTQY